MSIDILLFLPYLVPFARTGPSTARPAALTGPRPGVFGVTDIARYCGGQPLELLSHDLIIA